jgi:hypothetical protein
MTGSVAYKLSIYAQPLWNGEEINNDVNATADVYFPSSTGNNKHG